MPLFPGKRREGKEGESRKEQRGEKLTTEENHPRIPSFRKQRSARKLLPCRLVYPFARLAVFAVSPCPPKVESR